MNKVIMTGRPVKNPSISYTQGNDPKCIARFTLACDRKYKVDGGQNADFISCVAFGKVAEIMEKYLVKGTKICIVGRLQTGSYTNREGNKVYTTDVVAEEMEFCESKKNQSEQNQESINTQEPVNNGPAVGDGFMTIPDGIGEELPFI